MFVYERFNYIFSFLVLKIFDNNDMWYLNIKNIMY